VPDALAELERCSGTQFDPRVVRALDRLVEAERLPLSDAEPQAVAMGAGPQVWRYEGTTSGRVSG
jgi:HD-GYP domain-containing protein (c-di-GMP phosphodiesterase class II)